jgi:putative chitobiose transport system substrate-binding protein
MRALLIVLLLLVGCAGNPNTMTLRLWTLQLGAFAQVIQPMLDRFEAQHPGVRVQWVDVPFNVAEKRVLTALLSPDVPDVINLNPDFSAVLAARKAVLDMNTAVPAPVRRQYLPAAWQAVTTPDGVAYGVPWYLTSSVTLTNTRLLKDPPATLADLGRASVPAGAFVSMPALAEHGAFLKMMKRHGLQPYTTQGCAAFERGAGLLTFWKQQLDTGKLPAEALTEGHRAAVDRYQAGTLGMLLAGPNFLNIVKENAPQVYQHTQVSPQFPVDGHVEFSTMLLAVPVQSRHPKLAVDLALFLTNAENQRAFTQALPVLPSMTTLLQQRPAATTPLDRALNLSAEQLLRAPAPLPILPQQQAVNEHVDFAVQAAMLGKTSPRAALTKASHAVNALLEGCQP